MSWSDALTLSNHAYDLVGYKVQEGECMKRFYHKYPLASRITMVSANSVLGLLKPFLVPFIAVINLVVQPIIAGIRAYQGDSESAKKWAKAWCFSLLALAGIGGFMLLSAYSLTLLQGTALVVTACSLSIIIHVYRVSGTEDPKELSS
ncbi:MAG: hypothetical protein S4CHLAM45_14520 [Chlamydiales bacterium]|nr:hypothetical protein [Chlamydiales bacterium]MCH9620586.1 hypothetical protein [Chlamydiales bacterium]MCH9623542.1 hypothetical protein [Chlamydiales bacterium]